MAEPSAPNSTLLYGLDDKPPLPKAIVLGLQHVLTMFGSTVAVPLLLGPAMGMDIAQIAVLISSVMLCSGVATLLQSTLGSRLPIIQGVSFSFLAAFFGIIAAVVADPIRFPGSPMQYIAGAVIAGAVDAGLFVGAVIGIERLEHRGAPRPVQDFRRGVGERFGYGGVGETDLIVVAKQPPGQGDRCGLGQGGVQVAQRAIAHMNVDEFVNIQRQDPIRTAQAGHLGGLLQGRELDATLIMGAVIAHVLEPAHRIQPVQHRIRTIIAIV